MHECPKCGEQMQYIEDEPDVGITGGWICEACDIFLPSEDDVFEDDVI